MISLIVILVFYSPVKASSNPIVILKSADSKPYDEAVNSIRNSLSDERVIVFTLNYSAKNIVETMDKVSLISPKTIIGVGNSAILALKSAPDITVPAVFCLVTNLDGALSRPNSWVVPLQTHPEKFFEYLNPYFSGRRIGIPFNPNRSQVIINDLVAFYKDKQIDLYPFPVKSPEEMSPMLKLAKVNYDALWIIPDNSIIDSLTLHYIYEYSQKENLPLLGFSGEMTQKGAMISLSGNYNDMGNLAALTAKQIMAGDHPNKIQYPKYIVPSFNSRVARSLNIPTPKPQGKISTRFTIFPLNTRLRYP